MRAGRLDRRVTILGRSNAQEGVYGTSEGIWGPLATVWAEVQDVLPSRAERLAGEVAIANRPARVRMRWRTDVSQENRIQIAGRDGTWRIVSGPAEIGRREGIELMIEQVSTEGQQP
jgi:head-tail adaptor